MAIPRSDGASVPRSQPAPDFASRDARLLHHVFEETARRHPDRVALDVPPSSAVAERQTLTYAAINRLAERMAIALAPKLGDRDEPVVALLIPRHDPSLIVAQLAALKAGAAYTCLDPALPRERLMLILEDARPAVLLGTTETLKAITDPGVRDGRNRFADHTMNVRELRSDIVGEDIGGVAEFPVRPVGPPGDSSRLCYILFTSGTTGRPKGAMIEHGNIVNLVDSDYAYFDLGPEDRVAQGASASFDASIEEIWLAFAAGATLVVMDDEAVRLGPDLVPWLRRERITVFCPPPTLLRMCGDVDAQTALPDLRILYVGGEELPADVAARWSPGRRLVNGYGPTECAVVVTRAEIPASGPITIGKPVSGNEAWILDDRDNSVSDGEVGELCISGANVGRGYLGRQDLTERVFVDHPVCGRIYRTGDLARRLESGELECLGRIDAQVQIRGYRVELAEIESELCCHPDIVAAAATTQKRGPEEHLVAFVVPAHRPPPDEQSLCAHLAKRLPSYMIPAQIGVLDWLPTTPGGSLDRKLLPRLELVKPSKGERPTVAPSNDVETRIADAFASQGLGDKTLSVDDDFFFDLGGNSLLAARVISVLRQDVVTAGLTVRDFYETRTVAALAARVKPTRASRSRDGRLTKPRLRPRYRGAWVQGAWIVSTLAVGSNVLYWLAFTALPWMLNTIGIIPFLLFAPWLVSAAAIALCPLGVAALVACKRLLIGRYAPGHAPYLGNLYVRHWILTSLTRLVPWGLISGTMFQNAALRALGARIGRNVHIHTGVDVLSGGWDLLEVGDDVTLGRDAALRLVDLQDQAMVTGSITLGNGATIGTRARLCPGTAMEDNASLTDLSMLPTGARVPAGERWDGVPARMAGRTPDPPAPRKPPWSARKYSAVLLILRFLLVPVGALPLSLLAVAAVLYWNLDAPTILGWLYTPHGFGTAWTLVILAGITIASVLSLPVTALLIRALGRVSSGVYPLRGWDLIRLVLKGRNVERVGNVLSGTLFWPRWLRWSGMRVGRRSEVSSIMEVIPELVTLGEDCFLADGIYLGTPSLHRGTVTCGATRLAPNTFLGNHVVVPGGASLPGDILLGVCTVAEPAQIRPGTSWFGHPPFELLRREVVEVDRSLTHDPSRVRYFNRLFWESLRFFLPIVPAIMALLWLKTLPWWSARIPEALVYGVAVPLYTLTVGAIMCGLVVAAKWILLGRVRPGQHPLWSCWCSRWDFLYVMWQAYARPILSIFEGTPLLIPYLRAMGCRIGRRVVLGSAFAQVVDPDMLQFDDDATVACMFQAHSFEDRVLKIAPVRIGSGATASTGAVLMYGADIGDEARVAENSVVMKHEKLMAGRDYSGCPTRPDDPDIVLTT